MDQDTLASSSHNVMDTQNQHIPHTPVQDSINKVMDVVRMLGAKELASKPQQQLRPSAADAAMSCTSLTPVATATP
jgi:hypothetical protein